MRDTKFRCDWCKRDTAAVDIRELRLGPVDSVMTDRKWEICWQCSKAIEAEIEKREREKQG